jgi:hypothetical protein
MSTQEVHNESNTKMPRLTVAVNADVVPAKLLRACPPLPRDRHRAVVEVEVKVTLEEPRPPMAFSSTLLPAAPEESGEVHYPDYDLRYWLRSL